MLLQAPDARFPKHAIKVSEAMSPKAYCGMGFSLAVQGLPPEVCLWQPSTETLIVCTEATLCGLGTTSALLKQANVWNTPPPRPRKNLVAGLLKLRLRHGTCACCFALSRCFTRVVFSERSCAFWAAVSSAASFTRSNSLKMPACFHLQIQRNKHQKVTTSHNHTNNGKALIKDTTYEKA